MLEHLGEFTRGSGTFSVSAGLGAGGIEWAGEKAGWSKVDFCNPGNRAKNNKARFEKTQKTDIIYVSSPISPSICTHYLLTHSVI